MEIMTQDMDGNITLLELKNKCLSHQKQGRDCETCAHYKFCNYELTTSYPSGWKLDDIDDWEEPNILHGKDSNDIIVICNRCFHRIREYDLSPLYPNVEDLSEKLIESPKDLYPNYCEKCGVRLK